MKISNIIMRNEDSSGKLRSVVVNQLDSFDEIENLSIELGYYIYVIPDSRKCIFNEDGWLVHVENNNFEGIWEIYNGWSMKYDCLVNGFPFPIKMEEIWYSESSIEEIDIKELEWNLEYPWWSTDDEKPYDLKPKDFINHPNKYPIHIERTDKADTQYPLTLVQTKQNRWLIYDGVHRYLKLLIDGKRTISVKRHRIEDMRKYVYEKDITRYNEWINVKFY